MNVHFTLKHLKYFISIVEHQHFGRAADANFVTQPTLSAALKEFEEILGLQLLERTKRKVIVTPIGLKVLAEAKKILLQAQYLDDLCRSQSAPLSGKISLGIIPTIAPFLLPKIMPAMRSEYPELNLYLKEDQTENLLMDLDEGKLDVLILALPYEHLGIEKFVFMDDPFHLATPPDHPLSGRSSIDHGDLNEGELLLLEEGHCLREHALSACSLKAKGKSIDYGATSLHTLIEMVASGMGVTLIPDMAINTDLVKNSSVKTVVLAKDIPDRKIALIWRKTSGLGEDFKVLGNFLEKLMSST